MVVIWPPLARQVAVQSIGDRGQHKEDRSQNLLLATAPPGKMRAKESTAAAGS